MLLSAAMTVLAFALLLKAIQIALKRLNAILAEASKTRALWAKLTRKSRNR